MPAHSFNDYDKIIEENKGLRREIEAANQAIEKLESQLHQCREREAALRKVLEEIYVEHRNNPFKEPWETKRMLKIEKVFTALDSEGVE